MIPTDPKARLRRREAAEALTEAGFTTAPATLATMASRGGGPPFELWGRIPLYTWGPTLRWAEGRLSPPRRSTSESDVRAVTTKVSRTVSNPTPQHPSLGHRRIGGRAPRPPLARRSRSQHARTNDQ